MGRFLLLSPILIIVFVTTYVLSLRLTSPFFTVVTDKVIEKNLKDGTYEEKILEIESIVLGGDDGKTLYLYSTTDTQAFKGNLTDFELLRYARRGDKVSLLVKGFKIMQVNSLDVKIS